jgi:protein-S-isoprenylcysteine O-methyltransferase Ste14
VTSLAAGRVMERTGEVLFRWRSYLPLLLIPLVVWAIVGFRIPIETRAADWAWEIGSFLIALGGVGLRVWTVGTAAPGTSGRSTRRRQARSLNTTGPYSLIRHPLYVANVVIAVGLSLFPHAWLAPPIVGVLGVVYYICIARYEEAYLRERFGEEFRTWAARVHSTIPRFSGYVPASLRFDWAPVARREFYALALVLVAPIVLDAIEDSYERGRLVLDPLWVGVALVGITEFVALRFLKKRSAPA